jgi:hypothetical protein
VGEGFLALARLLFSQLRPTLIGVVSAEGFEWPIPVDVFLG